MIMTSVTRAMALCVVLTACGAKVGEPNDREVSTSLTVSVPNVPGYVHQFSKTRFHIGTGTRSVNELGLDKVIGSEGVFAVNPRTGSARAILNGDSLINNVPALTLDAEAHNVRVVRYFAEAGLPADQMGTPQILTSMEGGGPLNVKDLPADAHFVSYTTIIARVIGGIAVPDSFAAASFDRDDEVTTEWIYWPPIPQAAVQEAQSIQAMVGASANNAFVALLPAEAQTLPAEVTIRHSDFDDESGFKAFGSYDVHVGPGQLGHGRAATVCFGVDGKEVVHPNRRPGAPVAPGPTPLK
jgi:hypothetical protein